MARTARSTEAEKQGGGTSVRLLVAVEQLAVAHGRSEAERSDVTSSQNSAGANVERAFRRTGKKAPLTDTMADIAASLLRELR